MQRFRHRLCSRDRIQAPSENVRRYKLIFVIERAVAIVDSVTSGEAWRMRKSKSNHPRIDKNFVATRLERPFLHFDTTFSPLYTAVLA